MEIASYTAIGLGTLSGGWRIIKTMGTKITKLQPVGGFAAETGAAVAIFTATQLGVGISTTHTITGAIVGVGATSGCQRRALGRGGPDCVGVDPDDSRVGRRLARSSYYLIRFIRRADTPRTGWLGGLKPADYCGTESASDAGSATSNTAPPPSRFAAVTRPPLQLHQMPDDRQAESRAAGIARA